MIKLINLTEQEKEVFKDLLEVEPQMKRNYSFAVQSKDTEMLKYIEKSVKRIAKFRVA